MRIGEINYEAEIPWGGVPNDYNSPKLQKFKENDNKKK